MQETPGSRDFCSEAEILLRVVISMKGPFGEKQHPCR